MAENSFCVPELVLIRFTTGTYCFDDWNQQREKILYFIQHDFSRLSLAIEHGVTLVRLGDHPVIRQVKDSIVRNKHVVDKIESLSAVDLDTFLKYSKVFTFDSGVLGIRNVLLALSSYDGTRSYLKRFDTNLQLGDLQFPQRSLEHELMHNVSRWRKDDPRRISPSKNKNLKIRGRMVEAGDFYEFEVYAREVLDPCPFCLSEVARNPY